MKQCFIQGLKSERKIEKEKQIGKGTDGSKTTCIREEDSSNESGMESFLKDQGKEGRNVVTENGTLNRGKTCGRTEVGPTARSI